MGRSNEDLEARIAALEADNATTKAALRQLVAVLTQPGNPQSAWLRTSIDAEGHIGASEVFAELRPFASEG